MLEDESKSDSREDIPPRAPARGGFAEIEASINQMMPLAGRALAAVWNMEMKLLIAIGAMGFVQKYPWLLVVLAVALLAVFYPVGIVFAVTGFAAMSYNVSAKDQFLVDLATPI